jgi:CelD/BcsL family acetyltransferase involved in cellulose biosynthesis
MLTVPNAGVLRTITAHDFNALTPHIAAWDRLASESPQRIPTLLPGWVDAFLRHRLKPGERWLCSFAYDGDELVGALPIIASPHPVLGCRWPILTTPFDKFTPSGDIPLRACRAVPALNALLSEVSREIPRHVGVVFRAIRSSSPILEAIKGGISGYVMSRGARSLYSVLHVEGEFDTYHAGLGKLRRDLGRFRKKLESRGPASFEIYQGTVESEACLHEFLELEASGWKGRNGTSILNDPSVTAFYTTLFRNFALQKRWEWQAIRVGGKLVASGVGIRCGAALMVPKFAFDESFAECRPGSLLVKEVIRYAFSHQELIELNPMSHLDWGSHWRMSCDKYVDLHLVRMGIVPVTMHLPGVVIRSAYHNYVLPRIPTVMKTQYRALKRHKERSCSQSGNNPASNSHKLLSD